MAPVDHLEELELEGREGRQRAGDAGSEEGVGKAVLGVVVQAGDEVAEQERADHVCGERSPGPAARPVRRRLGQADARQGAKNASRIDRKQASRVY